MLINFSEEQVRLIRELLELDEQRAIDYREPGRLALVRECLESVETAEG